MFNFMVALALNPLAVCPVSQSERNNPPEVVAEGAQIAGGWVEVLPEGTGPRFVLMPDGTVEGAAFDVWRLDGDTVYFGGEVLRLEYLDGGEMRLLAGGAMWSRVFRAVGPREAAERD